jgi:hypothetical protein
LYIGLKQKMTNPPTQAQRITQMRIDRARLDGVLTTHANIGDRLKGMPRLTKMLGGAATKFIEASNDRAAGQRAHPQPLPVGPPVTERPELSLPAHATAMPQIEQPPVLVAVGQTEKR